MAPRSPSTPLPVQPARRRRRRGNDDERRTTNGKIIHQLLIVVTSVTPSHNATEQVATQLRGHTAQWKRRAVATQGSFAADMRGQCQRRPVLLQKCEDSGNAGQFCCRNAGAVPTQGSSAAEMRGAVPTQATFAAEMRGQCQRRAVLLQKCEESGHAGQLCCRNARKVATQASFAAEMRGKWQRRAVLLAPKLQGPQSLTAQLLNR